VIELNNVTKRYYSLVALDQLSLTIQPNEVLGIVGPNGAGKTTLFKLLAGLIRPDTGRIQARGTSWPTIGFKPERLLYPSHMRLNDYLQFAAALSNIPRTHIKQAVEGALAQLHLSEFAHKRVRDCSKGMRQRLGLAQAMLGNPDIVLLDEPTDGLDPDGQESVFHAIRALHEAGKTVIMASHQLQIVTDVCTRLIILNRGQLYYESAMTEALSLRPQATIIATQDLTPLASLLQSLHPEIVVSGSTVVLEHGALPLRRHVLSLMLGAGFDVVHVEQKRTTIHDIYAEVVR
jgi:ABC-type multidrug transport system ATPase subunit